MTVRLAKTLFVAAFLIAAFSASSAQAGTYQVQSCNDGNHGGSNVFSYFSNNGNFVDITGATCSGAGLIQAWQGTSDAPGGAVSGRYLDAPSGTYFSYLYWQQALTSQGGGARCVYATDAGGNMISDSNCITNTFNRQETGWVTKQGGLNSSRVYLNTACLYGPCTGGSSNFLWGQFGYMNANITDPTSPSVYGISGVWGRGWVRGSWPLSWNASDSMGVKIHSFQVDGSGQGSSQFCSPASLGGSFYYGTSLQPCPNPGQGGYQSASFTVPTTSYSNGTHSLSAVSYDSTDNAGSATTTLYVDNSLPSEPTISGGPSGWTSDTTPTFNLSSSDPQSGIGGYQCQVDSGSYYDCSSPVTLSPLSDGSHQFCARAYNRSLDTAGNPAIGPSSCTSFSVDTVPPSADLEAPGPWIAASGTTLYGTASDPISGLSSVAFEARPQSGGSWQELCSRSGSLSQPFSCPVDGSALDNGQVYELRLMATNNAGVSAASDLQTSRVDNQPPSAPSITAGPADGSWIATTSATYSFSSTDPLSGVASYQCNQDSWQSCESPHTFSGLSLGMNSLSFRAIDVAGNISSSTDRTVGSDTVPPVLDLDPLPQFISGTITVSGTATDSLSGMDSASVKFQSKEMPAGSWTDICATASQSGSDYSCPWDVSSLSGDYEVRMVGEDNAGNQPASWPSEQVTVANQAPSITLSDSGRVDDWTVTASPAGIDPNEFSAQYSTDSGTSWQEMDDGYWIPSSDLYRAAIPDSVPGNTQVEVRLSAETNAGVSGSQTDSFTIPLSPPVNTAPPEVSGTAQVGEELASTDGSWSGLPPITVTIDWLRCDTGGADCQRLSASGSTYTQVDQDAGFTIRSLALANNSDGEANAESSDFAGPVQASIPTPSSPPVISGTAQDGNDLSTSDGTWGGTPPFDYTYQWRRCDSSGSGCADITGANASSYEATSADVGATLRVAVTASNESLPGGGTATQESAATSVVQAEVPANTSLPTITGQAYDGQALSAGDGSWSGSTPLSYAYQWRQCDSGGSNCSDIPGANYQSLEVPPAAIGDTVRVQVTASNQSLPGGGEASATSEASAVIEQAIPQNTSSPSISGTEQEGSQLSATSGDWQGLAPITYSYQWQRCDSSGLNCQDIPGATSGGYLLESGDVGSRVQVAVTASNSAGQDSVTSSQTGVIAVLPDPPSSVSPPSISGQAKVGQSLTAYKGVWSGHTPISYAYQWQRCGAGGCSDISGATSSSYTLTQSDASQAVRVQVTATNSYGSDSVDSQKTAEVISLVPVNDRAPYVSGSPQIGDKLYANPGSWNADPSPTFSYEWLACNSFGSSCDVVGQGSEYTPTNSDQARYLVLRVTATNSSGSSVSESSPFGPIVPAPEPPKELKAPQISGSTQVGSKLLATSGEWSAAGVVYYQYQWLRCRDDSLSSCANITGAAGESYTPVNADFGFKLRVLVVASDAGGTSQAYASPTTQIAAPACVKVSSISSGSLKAGSARVKFTGSKSGYRGGSKPLTVKASSSRKVSMRWVLSGRPLTQKKAKSMTVKIPNSRLLVGKSPLSLQIRNGKSRKALSRTITTSACPPAIKLSPKPKTLSARIGSKRFRASISEIYKSLKPGRFKVSGSGAKYAWSIDSKKVSSKKSVSVSPTRFSPGARTVTLRITSSGKTRTLTWKVEASDYPN